MRDLRFRTLAALVLAVLLLTSLAGLASASLKITAPPNSWDDKDNRYQNANQVLHLDGQLQPFYVELGWDKVQHITNSACGATNSTQYAGDAEIGLAFTDVGTGAPGFPSSQDWALVDCSAFDAPNKYPAANKILFECVDGTLFPDSNQPCETVVVDLEQPCSLNTCATEIKTQFDIVVDLDCDGAIDPQFAPAGGLCMYWAAPKPPIDSPLGVWSNPLQARVKSIGDGDKTLTFNVAGPNAVGLQKLEASPVAASVNPLVVLLGVGLVGLAGLALAWRSARG